MKKGAAIAVGVALIALLVIAPMAARADSDDNVTPNNDDDNKPPDWVPDSHKPFWPLFQAGANSVGIDPTLLLALSKWENPNGIPDLRVNNPDGRGLMQIDGSAYAHPEISDDFAFDPTRAIPWAARELVKLKGQVGALAQSKGYDPMQAAVAAYNTGAGNVKKSLNSNKHPQTTTNPNGQYVDKVYGIYNSLLSAQASV